MDLMLSRPSGKKWNRKFGSFQGLVDVGTCNIHIVLNSFVKGLDKYGKDAEQLGIDLHSLLKYSAACCEDFRKLELNLMLRLRF